MNIIKSIGRLGSVTTELELFSLKSMSTKKTRYLTVGLTSITPLSSIDNHIYCNVGTLKK